MNKIILKITGALFAFSSMLWASEMPFPPLENNKVKLLERESPYVLEQGMIFGAKDTLEIEPGVVVLMGEYAKLMVRGVVSIVGTPEKPIKFSSADLSASWNGIHFISGSASFDIKYLTIENAFRNTIFKSRGIFENVTFKNNYYGLWVDESPEIYLSHCEFSRNRFALSVRAGKVLSADTKISNNVYGLYLEAGGVFEGDKALIAGNLETDIRDEQKELSSQGKKVSRSVWQRIETGF